MVRIGDFGDSHARPLHSDDRQRAFARSVRVEDTGDQAHLHQLAGALQSYTCAQLAQEAAALTDKSAELSAARQQNRIKWSVPFLGGDAQATNSRLTEVDGQLAAIEQVRNQKSCR